MFAWIAKLAASGIFKLFGSTILKPILDAWAHHENVDLGKFNTSSRSTARVAVAAMEANAQAYPYRASYLLTVFAWWPFRIVLLWLLVVSAYHYSAIILDSMPFFIPYLMDEAHRVGAWGVPTPPEPYDAYQREFLLFFIVGTPAAGVAGGALQALSAYLMRRR